MVHYGYMHSNSTTPGRAPGHVPYAHAASRRPRRGHPYNGNHGADCIYYHAGYACHRLPLAELRSLRYLLSPPACPIPQHAQNQQYKGYKYAPTCRHPHRPCLAHAILRVQGDPTRHA